MPAPPTPKRGPKAPPKKRENIGVASTLFTFYPSLMSDAEVRRQPGFQAVPWKQWEMFRAGAGTAMAWYAIILRLRFNSELVREVYTAEALEGFDQALSAAISVNQRHLETGQWEATPDELEWMRAGLEAAEQIQQENPLEVQVQAFRRTLEALRD